MDWADKVNPTPSSKSTGAKGEENAICIPEQKGGFVKGGKTLPPFWIFRSYNKNCHGLHVQVHVLIAC